MMLCLSLYADAFCQSGLLFPLHMKHEAAAGIWQNDFLTSMFSE